MEHDDGDRVAWCACVVAGAYMPDGDGATEPSERGSVVCAGCGPDGHYPGGGCEAGHRCDAYNAQISTNASVGLGEIIGARSRADQKFFFQLYVNKERWKSEWARWR